MTWICRDQGFWGLKRGPEAVVSRAEHDPWSFKDRTLQGHEIRTIAEVYPFESRKLRFFQHAKHRRVSYSFREAVTNSAEKH